MSVYMLTLPEKARDRYKEKLSKLGFHEYLRDDPYLDPTLSKKPEKIDLPAWEDDVTKWPSLEFGMIYTYLICSPGPFTCESMNAYRSLDAYNFYISGWVQTCYYRQSDTGFCIIKAKVNRSQAVTEKPHYAWVGIQRKTGSVECGHCTCMAGLGEVCSHMAAILFKIEANTRMGHNQVSCTSQPCLWNQSFVKKVQPLPLSSICFEKPKRNKDFSRAVKSTRLSNSHVTPTIVDDPSQFLMKLKETSPNAVIFSITEPKKSAPKDPKFPKNLMRLYDVNNKELNDEKLNKLCDKTFHSLNVTKEQSMALEEATRAQSKSGLWHEFRAGRITSSAFYDVAKSKVECPSRSILKKILNYDTNFSTAATKWGLQNEEHALTKYIQERSLHHMNFRVQRCGFMINTDFPHLGSSPDSIVSCDCCGEGTVEVKCPYTFKDENPCSVDSKSYCLFKHSTKCDNNLKTNHKYYFQVQGQMGIGNYKFCDFVCYTNKGVHIERINFDPDFFQGLVDQLTSFFKKCVLPELLTRKLEQTLANENKKSNIYCICGKDEAFGAMIACDSGHCSTEWYHMKCVGIVTAPKENWYCLVCRSAKQKKD